MLFHGLLWQPFAPRGCLCFLEATRFCVILRPDSCFQVTTVGYFFLVLGYSPGLQPLAGGSVLFLLPPAQPWLSLTGCLLSHLLELGDGHGRKLSLCPGGAAATTLKLTSKWCVNYHRPRPGSPAHLLKSGATAVRAFFFHLCCSVFYLTEPSRKLSQRKQR